MFYIDKDDIAAVLAVFNTALFQRNLVYLFCCLPPWLYNIALPSFHRFKEHFFWVWKLWKPLPLNGESSNRTHTIDVFKTVICQCSVKIIHKQTQVPHRNTPRCTQKSERLLFLWSAMNFLVPTQKKTLKPFCNSVTLRVAGVIPLYPSFYATTFSFYVFVYTAAQMALQSHISRPTERSLAPMIWKKLTKACSFAVLQWQKVAWVSPRHSQQ